VIWFEGDVPAYQRGSADRMLVSDIDDTLILPSGGDQPGLEELKVTLAERAGRFVFVVSTGRSLAGAVSILKTHGLPRPDFIVSSVGTCIHDGGTGQADVKWSDHLNWRWRPSELRVLGSVVPGLRLQEEHRQGRFKVSYYVDRETFDASVLAVVLERLAGRANAIVTQDRFLDLLPARASKGRAVRYLSRKLSISLSRTLACGDAGNDRDMLETVGRGVVVANYSAELEVLRNRPGVFFSSRPGAAGILEGIRHHRFP
jgi:sucrose-phosphate synthase